MFNIKKPIELSCVKNIITCSDSLGEKLRLNYELMNMQMTPEDLLFLLSTEPQEQEERNEFINNGFFNNNFKNTNINVDIINNFVNRILSVNTDNFTYADNVYVESILRKIGITDTAQFIKTVSLIENNALNIAKNNINKKTEINNQKRNTVNNFSTEDNSQTISEKDQRIGKNESKYFLQDKIFDRLMTKDIYEIVKNLTKTIVSDGKIINKNEVVLANQLNTINTKNSNELRNYFEAAPLTFAEEKDEEIALSVTATKSKAEEKISPSQFALLSFISNAVIQTSNTRLENHDEWLDMRSAISSSVTDIAEKYNEYLNGESIFLDFEQNYETISNQTNMQTMNEQTTKISTSTSINNENFVSSDMELTQNTSYLQSENEQISSQKNEPINGVEEILNHQINNTINNYDENKIELNYKEENEEYEKPLNIIAKSDDVTKKAANLMNLFRTEKTTEKNNITNTELGKHTYKSETLKTEITQNIIDEPSLIKNINIKKNINEFENADLTFNEYDDSTEKNFQDNLHKTVKNEFSKTEQNKITVNGDANNALTNIEINTTADYKEVNLTNKENISYDEITENIINQSIENFNKNTNAVLASDEELKIITKQIAQTNIENKEFTEMTLQNIENENELKTITKETKEINIASKGFSGATLQNITNENVSFDKIETTTTQNIENFNKNTNAIFTSDEELKIITKQIAQTNIENKEFTEMTLQNITNENLSSSEFEITTTQNIDNFNKNTGAIIKSNEELKILTRHNQRTEHESIIKAVEQNAIENINNNYMFGNQANMGFAEPLMSSEEQSISLDAQTKKILEAAMLYQEDPVKAIESGIIKHFGIDRLGYELNAASKGIDYTTELSYLQTDSINENITAESLKDINRNITSYKQGYKAKYETLEANIIPSLIIHKRDIEESIRLDENTSRQNEIMKSVQTIENTVNNESISSSIINNMDTQRMELFNENVSQIVSKTINKQMNTITDRVYSGIEKRLKGERSRRGV